MEYLTQIDFLSHFTLGELISGFLGITAVICTILEKIPQAISPWTKLFKFIGTITNGEVLQRLGEIEGRLDSFEARVKANEDKAEEDKAIEARVRIIRFGDEIIHGVMHSKDYFDQILKDIATYENHCVKYPEFENNITEMTIEHIKETYLVCMKEHTFL